MSRVLESPLIKRLSGRRALPIRRMAHEPGNATEDDEPSGAQPLIDVSGLYLDRNLMVLVEAQARKDRVCLSLERDKTLPSTPEAYRQMLDGVVNRSVLEELLRRPVDPFDNADPEESAEYLFWGVHATISSILDDQRGYSIDSGPSALCYHPRGSERTTNYAGKVYSFLTCAPHLWQDETMDRACFRLAGQHEVQGRLTVPDGRALPYVWLNFSIDRGVEVMAFKWPARWRTFRMDMWIHDADTETEESFLGPGCRLDSLSVDLHQDHRAWSSLSRGPRVQLIYYHRRVGQRRLHFDTAWEGRDFFLLLTEGQKGNPQVWLNRGDTVRVEPVVFFWQRRSASTGDDDTNPSSTEDETWTTSSSQELDQHQTADTLTFDLSAPGSCDHWDTD